MAAQYLMKPKRTNKSSLLDKSTKFLMGFIPQIKDATKNINMDKDLVEKD